MAQLYRQTSDSSAFAEPRALARVFAGPGQFEASVRRYEKLMGKMFDMDLDARELGVRIAAVGSFLIIEFDPAQADRFELARNTPVTIIFADLDAAVAASVALGAEVITNAGPTAVGRGAWLRHPDGLLVEYLEHRPGEYDVDVPSF